MGFFTPIIDFITSFDGFSYRQDSKVWGNEVWEHRYRLVFTRKFNGGDSSLL